MRSTGACLKVIGSALVWAAGLAPAGCSPGDPQPTRRDDGGAVAAAAPSSWTEEMATELRSMGREDQAVREGFGPETMADTAFLGRMARTDSANSRRLRALIEAHGWPTAGAVGGEAAEAAFLVVQHTPFDTWQRAMLPHIEAGVHAGSLDPQDYALLYDRVQVHQGLPQRYGTQLAPDSEGVWHLDPLEDSTRVDSLRAALGLPPLADYLQIVESALGVEVARPDIP